MIITILLTALTATTMIKESSIEDFFDLYHNSLFFHDFLLEDKIL